MNVSHLLRASSALAVSLVALASTAAAPGSRPAAVSPVIRADAAATSGLVEAIVTFREIEEAASPAARRSTPSPERIRWIAGTGDALAADLAPLGTEIVKRYSHLPMMAVRLPAATLDVVAADPRVESISPNLVAHEARTDGNALINTPAVHSLGFRGEGVGIAILDTGVDYTQAELSPPGVKTIKLWDVIGNDDDPMDEGTTSHGTKVAAIAAGSVDGAAPDATVIAVRVLDSAGDGNSFDIVDGLDRVLASVTNGNPHNIRAAVLSIGGYAGSSWPPNSGSCDLLDFATRKAFDDLTTAGVLVVVAAGNGGCTNGIAWPACISSGMAVGAVYDAAGSTLSFGSGQCQSSGCSDLMAADKIACYSDSGDQLAVWAPAHCARVPNRFGSYESCFGGTSAAAPYVAGVAALMSEATGAGPEVLRAGLEGSGRPIVDGRNGLMRRRVDAEQALLSLSGSCIDAARPEALSINGLDPCGSTQTFTVNWNAAPNATSYLVEVSADTGFSSVSDITTSDTSLTYAFSAAKEATFAVRVQALNGCSGSAFSDVLVVRYAPTCSAGSATEAVVSGIAHTPGLAPSFWFSDVAVLNPSSTTTAQITLTFHGRSLPRAATATLPPLQQVVWRDILTSLFGLATNDVGVIRVESTSPVTVLARTYSQASDTSPTYGQAYPAIPVDRALLNGQVGYLANLRADAPFYTNLEIVNVGEIDAQVQVLLRSADGQLLNTPSATMVRPLERVALVRAVPNGTNSAFAEIRVLTPGGKAIAFASVVDNLSRDPTMVPLAITHDGTPAGSGPVYVTGVARTPGYAPAFWYSDVSVLNTSVEPSELTLTFHGAGEVLTSRTTLSPATQATWRDILGTLFVVGGYDAGFVEVEGLSAAAVLARTYARTSPTSASVGQSYIGTTASEGLLPGQMGYLPGLRSDSPFYSNIELVNIGAETVRIEVRFFTNGGVQIGRPLVRDVAAARRVAVNRALAEGHAAAFAEVRLLSTTGVILATAAVVDDRSKDPTMVPMTVVTPG